MPAIRLDGVAGESSSPLRPARARVRATARACPGRAYGTRHGRRHPDRAWRTEDRCRGSAPRPRNWALARRAFGRVRMSRSADTETTRSRPLTPDFLFERLANQ